MRFPSDLDSIYWQPQKGNVGMLHGPFESRISKVSLKALPSEEDDRPALPLETKYLKRNVKTMARTAKSGRIALLNVDY